MRPVSKNCLKFHQSVLFQSVDQCHAMFAPACFFIARIFRHVNVYTGFKFFRHLCQFIQ